MMADTFFSLKYFYSVTTVTEWEAAVIIFGLFKETI